jgi:hypothetical protein
MFMKIQHARIVEEYLAAVGQDILDHVINRIVERRLAATGVWEQMIALSGGWAPAPKWMGNLDGSVEASTRIDKSLIT